MFDGYQTQARNLNFTIPLPPFTGIVSKGSLMLPDILWSYSTLMETSVSFSNDILRYRLLNVISNYIPLTRTKKKSGNNNIDKSYEM